MRGTCTDDIAIGSFCTSHTLWVADITDECIIGLDFLRKHDGLVDLRDDVLHLDKQEVPLHCMRSDSEPLCY